MTKERIRHTVHFTGHVQGVGFRYSAMNLARGHEVAGYVQNLPDGRVLMVVEGDEDKVEAFVSLVNSEMRHFVREQQIDRSPATGEFGEPGVDALAVRY